MPTELTLIRSARRRPAPTAAFTLTELLIVMAVIVLALTLAIPAIKALTGNKSEQAAQNIVSAFLVRARTEAIGLQQIEGVLFYIDPATNRTTCVQVVQVPPVAVLGDRADVTYLDVVADHDTLALPPGLRIFTMKDTSAVNFVNDRYLGFNFYLNSPNAVGGVILFDPEGRIITRIYGLHLVDVNPVTGARSLSALGRLMGFTSLPATNWPPNGITGPSIRSQLAFVFVAPDDLKAAGAAARMTYTDGNDASGVQAQKEKDLDRLTTPIFVNRYNGTLVRAE